MENSRMYVGQRYVPKIMGEWSKSETYEGLSIVTNEGNSYTSKKRVPIGIDITNEEFWVVTGNYNAQIEQYRQEVQEYKDDTTSLLNENEGVINVKKMFNAKGDGVTDDTTAIQSAIEYGKVNGLKVYLPKGDYVVSKNLILYTGMTLYGMGKESRIIKKTASTNVDNIDCIIFVKNQNNFKIKELCLVGNRTPFLDGNTVTTNGLYITGCSYFEVNSMNIQQTYNGVISKTNWCCSYENVLVQQSQDYAFRVSNSSTSTVFKNPTAWGCGGAFNISASIYCTIINLACDHSDAGKKADDPFLPTGSGGDYLNPKYIFYISASRVTIISPGTENSYSKYIYGEGADVILMNPFTYNIQNYASTYRFIELRGTGKSNLEIINPNFTETRNMSPVSPTISGMFIESPQAQKIKINKFIKLSDTFGSYEYPNNGLLFGYTNNILHINDQNLLIGGGTPFISNTETTKSSIIVEGDSKKLKLENLTATSESFKLFLPNTADLLIRLNGTFLSSYAGFTCVIKNDLNGVIKDITSFVSNAGDINTQKYITLNETGKTYLEIKLAHSSDVLTFKELIVTQIL